jgi:hypothetical protein
MLIQIAMKHLGTFFVGLSLALAIFATDPAITAFAKGTAKSIPSPYQVFRNPYRWYDYRGNSLPVYYKQPRVINRHTFQTR